MAISVPDVITRYFAAQAARDFDTLLTLFDTVRYHEFYRAGLWRDETLYDVVRAHSEQAPERIALRSTHRNLTYRMLLSHVDAFASVGPLTPG